MFKNLITAFLVSVIVASLSACDINPEKSMFNRLQQEVVMLELGKNRDINGKEPIRALPDPAQINVSPALKHLGKRLYNDTRLSGDGSISCASCHDLTQGGDDGLMFSEGIDGKVGSINAPSVLNAAFNLAQFWDGRAKDLQEQAAGPVTNPIEMGAEWDEVIDSLKQAGDYDEDFKAVYGDREITQERITHAIASFEKTLITPSPFDRYLSGETTAISHKARHGYDRFKRYGCVACHQGINVGGNLYQKFGAIQSYYEMKSDADKGRYSVTGDIMDKAVFKVPSLHNVALTAPYFHNGAAPDLATAIRIMGTVQLGRTLTDDDVAYIEAFLHSLTGEVIHD